MSGVEVARSYSPEVRFGKTRVATAVMCMGGIAAIGAAWLSPAFSANSGEPAAARDRKCVGIFVSGERRNVAADSKSLVVVGTIPCAERGVMSWSMQGVYRAFEDGTVEFLASPTPPCPEGDAYVWIRFPNPAQ